MTPRNLFDRAAAALMVGAFAVSACGGTSPTGAPSTAAGTQAAPSTAATTPPASQPAASDAAPSAAPASTGSGVDPAAELKIAAPYTFEPLNESVAATFITAMKTSLGQMADTFDVGVRSAVKGGATTAWVLVMRFPALGIGGDALLEGAAAGAAGGADVEKRDIGGQPVRIVEAQGSAISMTVTGRDLVMVIPLVGAKPEAIAVVTAIIEAN